MDLSKYDNLDFPERLKKLTELAKKADKWHKVFGSKTHKYKFNTVISLAEVCEFEERNNIKLPDSLVRYLTEIGNGGAGVDYGIYSLKKMEKFSEEQLLNCDSEKTIFDYENYKEVWKNLIIEMDNTENDEICDKIYNQLTNGWLVIGTSGCTYDYIIICKGKNYGKIAIVDWNMFEDNPPYILSDSFENWIETYFKKIIQGNLTDRGSFKTVNEY